MLTFALVSPLGIAIGIVIAEASAFDPEGHSLIVGILQGKILSWFHVWFIVLVVMEAK